MGQPVQSAGSRIAVGSSGPVGGRRAMLLLHRMQLTSRSDVCKSNELHLAPGNLRGVVEFVCSRDGAGHPGVYD